MLPVVVVLVLSGLAATAVGDVLVFDTLETLVDEFNDLPARFGPLFPLDGLSVYAVMSSSINGCKEMDPPPKEARAKGDKFVVLIARNNCTFYEKVINAEKALYDAAIVYNTDSDDLVEMSGDSDNNRSVNIPSMFIGYFSAMQIKENFLFDQGFALVLNRDLPFNVNKNLLWPFVCIVFICFVTMIIVTVVKYLRHRSRVQRDRLTSRELRKLRVIPYVPETPACRFDTCSICLDEFIPYERLRLLPCRHYYHTKCIDPWLTKGKRNCPLCKCKIRTRRTRMRRPSSDSSSSGSSTHTTNDTTPLLNNDRSVRSTMGTFPGDGEGDISGGGGSGAVAGEVAAAVENRDSESGEVVVVASGGGFRGFLSRLFRRSSPNDEESSAGAAIVNERENMLPASVSAVVDMSPPPPSISSTVSGTSVPLPLPPVTSADLATGVIITTPISSPLRRPSGQQGSSSSGSSGVPRIGVAALPNFHLDGPPPPAHLPPPPPAVLPQQSLDESRSNRERRGGSRRHRRR